MSISSKGVTQKKIISWKCAPFCRGVNNNQQLQNTCGITKCFFNNSSFALSEAYYEPG